jgi:hypothetical protein
MKSAKDDLHGMVSTLNEAFTRKAIRDLLHEHDGVIFPVQLHLSLWLEEEYRAYHKDDPNYFKDYYFNDEDKTP